MKQLIEKLASGNAVYETPDVEISENRIAVELETGQTVRGEIAITGKSGLPVKGVVYSTDSHVTFPTNQFFGIHNKVYYEVHGKNLSEGQICSGTISVITTGGDYAIPFGITIKKTAIQSTKGTISTLQEFVKLVQESYDEALLIFLSKEFQVRFLKNDSFGYTLYHQVMKNGNRHAALEEFLVGMGLKEPVRIQIKEHLQEFTDIEENYADTIEIVKSTWGYMDVDVLVEGDFLYNCKEKISGEEFNGKIAEYQYFMNANKLHGGSNHAKITFLTFHDTVTFDVVIVNQKDSLETYLNEKRNHVDLVKKYLDFRTGVIDSVQWTKAMNQLAEERFAADKNDVTGLLLQAHVSLVQNHNEEASGFLNQISHNLTKNRAHQMEEYCFYLYLRTLYKNNPEYTHDIKEEIKGYFENGHDSWQLLWILFYMDERYEENPSLKYTMIKRLFAQGCHSPVMYYEASDILVKQPELLRVINPFEVQVLNFAGRYHMVKEELAKQTATLLNNQKNFNQTYFQILTRIYEDTKQDDILACICAMIINGEKTDHKYFSWLELGVRHELKLTNLYEYYIYAADTESFAPLQMAAYRYFSYGTDTLAEKKDYFYANLIVNLKEDGQIYPKYREELEKYVTSQILQGKNNRFLQIVYNEVLSKEFVVDDMENRMFQILNTYEIHVPNQNVKAVYVCRKETGQAQMTALDCGVANIQIDTKNPVITFMDYQGRIYAKTDYDLMPLTLNIQLESKNMNDIQVLRMVEEMMENPSGHQGKISELKRAVEMPGISKQFELALKEFIVDYYYKGFDQGDLDIYLLSLDLRELTIPSRNKVMEILIRRNLFEMAYPHIARYGYQGIQKELLEQLCLSLVSKEEFFGNKLLTEMCSVIFRNGCREKSILTYLGKYYEAGSLELYQLFLALQAKEIEDNTLAERLLIQYLFEANTGDEIYNIYREYLKQPTSSVVRRAFYTYVTYNYFIKKVQCPKIVWEILEQEYADGFQTTLITKIAFMEVLSKKEQLTEQQITIAKKLLEDLAKNHILFDFYKKFNQWFKVPYHMIDKTVIDFRTNPRHHVDITYRIKTEEGFTKTVTEEMGSVYQGIFSKEIIMFYGEEIHYSIKEYSDEFPEGKIVDNYSVKITDKNTYNDETRFGMINGMMICRQLERDEAAREIMQSYELDRVAGQKLFKLL